MMKTKGKSAAVIRVAAAILLALLLAACEDSTALSKTAGSSSQGDAALAAQQETGSGQEEAESEVNPAPEAEKADQSQDTEAPAEGGADTAANEAGAGGQGSEAGQAVEEAAAREEAKEQKAVSAAEKEPAQDNSSGQQTVSSGENETGSSKDSSSKEAVSMDASSDTKQEEKPENIPQPAVITQDPKNADVKAGETAVFTVAAQGTGLKYQWEKKKPTEDVWKKSEADGKKTATLTVKEAKSDWHGMSYRCKVTDSSGNTVYSKAAKLYVLCITQEPSSQYLKKGKTAVFSVKAKGAGLVFQWELKTPSSDEWKKVGSASPDKSRLMIEDVKPSWNRYRYRCKVSNAAGKAIYSKSAELSVLSIKSNPSTKYIKEGNTAVFNTSATGIGLSYQWQVKDSEYSDWRYSTGSGNSTATLSIYGNTNYNGFRYRCMVTDGRGNVSYCQPARIFVLGIKKNPSDKTVKADETAAFSVSAIGGGLSYQWQFKKPSGGDWKKSSASGNKTRTLKFQAKTSLNGFKYRCRIKDRKGNTVYSRAAKLSIVTITQNPSTKKIKAGDTAVFQIKASGSGLKYSWQIKRSSGDGWVSSSAAGHSTNRLLVEGLTKYNGSQFRCKVTGPGGLKAYSKPASLFVLGITQNPSDRFAPSGKSVSFSVKAVGPGLKYQWQYYKKSTGEWSSYKGSGNTKSTMSVTGKASLDGLRFRCRVKDNAGNVVYSKSAKLSVFK